MSPRSSCCPCVCSPCEGTLEEVKIYICSAPRCFFQSTFLEDVYLHRDKRHVPLPPPAPVQPNPEAERKNDSPDKGDIIVKRKTSGLMHMVQKPAKRPRVEKDSQPWILEDDEASDDLLDGEVLDFEDDLNGGECESDFGDYDNLSLDPLEGVSNDSDDTPQDNNEESLESIVKVENELQQSTEDADQDESETVKVVTAKELSVTNEFWEPGLLLPIDKLSHNVMDGLIARRYICKLCNDLCCITKRKAHRESRRHLAAFEQWQNEDRVYFCSHESCDFSSTSVKDIMQHRGRTHKNIKFFSNFGLTELKYSEDDFEVLQFEIISDDHPLGAEGDLVFVPLQSQYATEEFRKERHFPGPKYDKHVPPVIEVPPDFRKLHPDVQDRHCGVCFRYFNTMQEKRRHLHENHALILCQSCSYTTDNSRLFMSHLKTAHREPCKECGFVITNREKNGHECPSKIGPGAPNPDELDISKKHQNGWQLTDGSYVCSKCGLMSSRSVVHYRHVILVHSGIKCKFCPSTVPSKKALSRHMRDSHYLCCELCGFKAEKKEEMFVHNCDPSQTYGGFESCTQFKCKICGHIATKKTNLRLHMEQMHKKISVFKCDQCEKQLTTKAGLRVHVRTIHQKLGRKFPCNSCDYCAFSREAIEKHVIRMHMK